MVIQISLLGLYNINWVKETVWLGEVSNGYKYIINRFVQHAIDGSDKPSGLVEVSNGYKGIIIRFV